MKPSDVLGLYVLPALALLPERMQTINAEAGLLAIALQETDLKARLQIRGPARSFWQFERIGVAGVLRETNTAGFAVPVLQRLGYPNDVDAVFEAMAWDSILAAVMARLNLYKYPGALPGPNDLDEGWRQYIVRWKPGRPRPDKWPACYAKAWEVVCRAQKSNVVAEN